MTDRGLRFVERGSGPVLLLVHGFPLDHTMWVGQIDHFAEQFRVLAPDLRGFGQSPPGEPVLTMSQLADDLAGLLDSLSIRRPIVLCGLSLGGYVAMQFWARHADRLRGLVLCDTRAAADTAEAATNRHAMAEKVLREGSSVAADAMLPKIFPPAVNSAKPAIYQATRNVILSTPPATIAAAQRGMADRPDMRGELGKIQVPTLVICGELDAISPPDEMLSIAAAIPQGQFVEIPGAGHMSPLEAPEQFNRALEDWLNKLP